MHQLRATTGLLLLLLTACGPPSAQSHAYPLDTAELQGNDGWQLRVHGDGSGTLRHRQHPLHHLDYPARTFDLRALSRAAQRCSGTDTEGFDLRYYRARTDRETFCHCRDTLLLNATMTTAITYMQTAVDDEVSARSCRMLRREWLVSR